MKKEIKKPDKSGSYIALSDCGYVGNINYSKKHDLWNASDNNTREKAFENAIYNIVGWIEHDKFVDFIKQNGGQKC